MRRKKSKKTEVSAYLKRKRKTELKMTADFVKPDICTVGVRYAASVNQGIGNVWTYRALVGRLYLGCEVVVPVGSSGQFDTRVLPYAGMQVFDANHQIVGKSHGHGGFHPVAESGNPHDKIFLGRPSDRPVFSFHASKRDQIHNDRRCRGIDQPLMRARTDGKAGLD